MPASYPLSWGCQTEAQSKAFSTQAETTLAAADRFGVKWAPEYNWAIVIKRSLRPRNISCESNPEDWRCTFVSHQGCANQRLEYVCVLVCHSVRWEASMNREGVGSVGGTFGTSDRGRETCKLHCEEAFRQRRESESRREANILKTEKAQKGKCTGWITEVSWTHRWKKKVTILDVFFMWELAAGTKRYFW